MICYKYNFLFFNNHWHRGDPLKHFYNKILTKYLLAEHFSLYI